MGDEACSSRDRLRRREIKATLAQPKDQREHCRRTGSADGRPPVFDRTAYRGCNTVERSINLFQQNRAFATRYDKRAATFDSAVLVASVRNWLRDLADSRPLPSRDRRR
ncbi:hypothetical protein [Nocardiopsis synnemataformans]|uniref:hypothetical protein n=1 Tax=Nocardiopsis synnemataformans TaxID=61305 RepID=UPI003EBCEA97